MDDMEPRFIETRMDKDIEFEEKRKQSMDDFFNYFRIPKKMIMISTPSTASEVKAINENH